MLRISWGPKCVHQCKYLLDTNLCNISILIIFYVYIHCISVWSSGMCLHQKQQLHHVRQCFVWNLFQPARPVVSNAWTIAMENISICDKRWLGFPLHILCDRELFVHIPLGMWSIDIKSHGKCARCSTLRPPGFWKMRIGKVQVMVTSIMHNSNLDKEKLQDGQELRGFSLWLSWVFNQQGDGQWLLAR